MGLAVLYQRESAYCWSITHRPTRAFVNCFPVQPLPSPADGDAFLKAVRVQVQLGVARFIKGKPEYTAVAERIYGPLEGLMGWHDFYTEDGSYNSTARMKAFEQLPEEDKTLNKPTGIPSSSSKAPPKTKQLPSPSSSKAKAAEDGVQKTSMFFLAHSEWALH